MHSRALKTNLGQSPHRNVRAASPDASLIQIYQCLCDPTRLRILNLLTHGELCVCHFQDILGEPQVKVSKHLAYLRTRGLVVSRKEANWVIYSLPPHPSPELSANLACLQDCLREDATYRRDQDKRRRLAGAIAENSPVCRSPGKRKVEKTSQR